MRELGCPTLVYLDGHEEKLQRRYESASLRFARRRPDPTLVGRQCDLAVLNAGHGMTVSMLTAGKPVLQLPIYLEQTLTAAATVRLGVGLSARINRPEEIAVKLMAILCGEEHSEAARGFAGRCAELDSGCQAGNALRRIEGLLG